MKRLFLILTILATSISLCYGVIIDGIYYKINAKEKTAEVCGVTNSDGTPSGGIYSGAIVIPETIEFKGTTLKVTSIGDYAFYDCKKISSIYLPNTILSIKAHAFLGCHGLTSITIPESVVSIEEGAFNGCGLTEITIPNRVESIGNGAFSGCENLKKVTIEDGEKNIEFHVNELNPVSDGNRCMTFGGCPLETLYLGRNISYDISYPQNYNCSPFRKSSLKEVTIGNSVTCINAQAFLDCKKLVSIDIANSVTEIETQAFSGCESLSSINIPKGITNINASTFSGCRGLTSICIPSNVTTIGRRSFAGCFNLSSITIPENVTEIGEEAFSNCTSLTSITLPRKMTSISGNLFAECYGLTSITIPEDVESIGSRAFWRCISLTSVTIPEGMTTIGVEAFSDCKKLKIIELPNTLTAVPAAAFQGCKGLNTVKLGKSIKAIETSAFDGCTELSEVYCYSKTVPQAGNDLFKDSWIEFLTLYVPYGTSELYQAKSPWSKFGTIIEMEKTTHTLTYMIDGEVYKVVEYDTNDDIAPVDAPQKEGYTFSGWDGLPDTMPAEDVTVNGTFAANEYHLTYIVDGAIYKEYDVKYDTTIKAEDEPTKEGFTFSGWNGLPEKMPAGDVTVTGTFAINSYTLTYILDGEVYKTVTLEYGSDINSESVPEKEGYTFSGWENLPETMPAKDVTVTGSFTINQYSVTFIIDGEVFETMTLNYGSEIVPPNVPEKENYDFSWGEFPETMPARDITVYGSYTSTMQDCLLSVNGINGGTFALKCKTTATYSFIISPEEGWKISTLTFNGEDVTANLTDDSYTTPALTGNSELSIVFEHDGSEVKKVNGEVQLRVYAIASVLIIQNSGKEQQAAIYTTDGKMVKQVIAEQGTTRTPLQEGHVYLVKIGERTFKVAM